jgi:hypothetical protein
MLRDHPVSLHELAMILGLPPKDVYEVDGDGNTTVHDDYDPMVKQQAITPRYCAAGKPGIQRRPGAGGMPKPCSCSGHPSGLVLGIGVRHDGRA